MMRLTNFFNFIKPNKKLHIFYKHIHSQIGKNRPDWFNHEKCFANLIASLELTRTLPLSIRLTVLFDEANGLYEDDFVSQYFFNSHDHCFEYEFQKYLGGSQRLAGLYLLDYIDKKNISDNEYIYILENDYLHTFDWTHHFYELLNNNLAFDYVSLYDHADKYPFRKGFHEMHSSLQSKVFVAGQRHWRTVPSTCYSFITKGKIFREDFKILKSDLMDHEMFAELEKKGRILLTPIPGLSTHCMNNLLSPCVDWEKYLINQTQKVNPY